MKAIQAQFEGKRQRSGLGVSGEYLMKVEVTVDPH